MGKRKSILEDLFDVLFESTGMMWQVGAVVSIVLAFLSVRAFFRVQTWSENATNSSNLAPLAETLTWLLYGLPLMIGLVAIVFAIKTYQVYTDQQHY